MNTEPTLFDTLEDAPLAEVVPIGQARARRTDPETSHLAAATVETVTTADAVLMAFILHGPMADFELEDYYGEVYRLYKWPRQSPSGIRSRRSELVTGGMLFDTGRRIPTPSGRLAIVWTAPK